MVPKSLQILNLMEDGVKAGEVEPNSDSLATAAALVGTLLPSPSTAEEEKEVWERQKTDWIYDIEFGELEHRLKVAIMMDEEVDIEEPTSYYKEEFDYEEVRNIRSEQLMKK